MKLKKFLIGIILVLVFVIIFCLGIIIKKKYFLKVADNINLETQSEIESEALENIENTTNLENEIVEIATEENNSDEIIEKNIVEEPKKESTTAPVVKENTPKTTSKNVSNNKQTTVKIEQPQVQPQTQPKTEIITPTKQEEPKVTEEKKDSKPEETIKQEENKIETKYVRNDAMINKIKQVIQSNESEYMKTYGYEIVVDSSIKEHTNQFSFTENRVKAYITNTFGTIKIYAEDYYVNGELLMTECYIL